MINQGLAFQKILIRNYNSFPGLWRIAMCGLVLLIFNMTAWPYMKFGLESALDASFFWVDEGRHMDTLETMQATRSLKLIHPAYTAFYPNLSFLFAWAIELGRMPISPQAFAWGSKWVSLISINLHLLVGFALCYRILASFKWAFLGLILLAGQRFYLSYGTLMHPEALMLLFTTSALYAGTLLLVEGKTKHLWGMAAATGLALGAKLQVIFLIPWGGLMFLFMIWKFRKFSVLPFLLQVVISSVILVTALFAVSPYQLIHFSDLIQGIRGESLNITDYWQGRYSAWHWLSQVTSELHFGPFFSFLFLLAMLLGSMHIIAKWKLLGRELLDQPAEVFFIANLLWIGIGAGYIVSTYRVFTDRYLIHIHISLVLVIVSGLYWWVQEKRPFYNLAVKSVIILLLYGGVQGQWRHTRRDIERRETINDLLEPHRRFGRELPQHVPYDANILHTIRVYISAKNYPYSRPLFSDVPATILGQKDLDYLIINNNYRPAMRSSVLMRGSQQDTDDTIEFWKKLEKDGINGMFSVVAHFPQINVTIYRKVKAPQ
ncbi:MAG: hypothetical protein HQM13_08715 [SAR324 cluster bacterium]|nr:hypothetical protein [SAR324 cluster bacterium]